MNSRAKIAIALLALGMLCWLAWMVAPRQTPAISYSQFIKEVRSGRVMAVKISAGNAGADSVDVRMRDGTSAHTILPLDYSAALEDMQQAMVNVEIQDASTSPGRLLINAVPFLILLALWIYLMTRGRSLLGRL